MATAKMLNGTTVRVSKGQSRYKFSVGDTFRTGGDPTDVYTILDVKKMSTEASELMDDGNGDQLVYLRMSWDDDPQWGQWIPAITFTDYNWKRVS